MTPTRVGFIGLGAMGSRMAARLQKSGRWLIVFNRTRDKAQSLLSEPVTWADTPAALAEQAEALFTMLAHGQPRARRSRRSFPARAPCPGRR